MYSLIALNKVTIANPKSTFLLEVVKKIHGLTVVPYMFKVNIKDTRKRSFESFLVSLFLKLSTCCQNALLVKTLIVLLNPFHSIGLFLYLLKTSVNFWFFDVFRGYREIPVA